MQIVAIDHRHNRIALHLTADRTGDTVGCDLLFIHAKLIRQRLVQLFALVHVQGTCLDDNLVASGYLLGLMCQLRR